MPNSAQSFEDNCSFKNSWLLVVPGELALSDRSGQTECPESDNKSFLGFLLTQLDKQNVAVYCTSENYI